MNAGTKVKILMKNGLHFNGVVNSSDDFFLHIIDRFNKPVSIAKSEISLLEVLS